MRVKYKNKKGCLCVSEACNIYGKKRANGTYLVVEFIPPCDFFITSPMTEEMINGFVDKAFKTGLLDFSMYTIEENMYATT